MKFSVNWLREFVEMPNDISQLADLLTLAGVEIERIETRGADFENVVVAQITESKPHPNADRLSVCIVDDGSGKNRQIVCGAKNYKVGDKVPLALPGAVLPNDLKIRASKLRGIESEGMLCSAKELALSDESAGLLILSAEAKVGAPIGTLFPADTILDVEITPNRGDLLSHIGLSREIAALLGKPLQLPTSPSGDKEITGTKSKAISIAAKHECPFYSARRIDNVTVSAAPDWMRAKLEACGIRPINNIVDIANFVMLELGQPLHTFDADKIEGAINVRKATPAEKFLALDGKTYSLGEKDLVIADAKRAIGIAGVMGGEESGVTATTRNLILESAYFLPASVRRTARQLNLPSDASYRFERGVDPEMILRASARATQLIQEIAHGNPAQNLEATGTLPERPEPVALRYDRCRKLLGHSVESNEIDEILQGFGLAKVSGNAAGATWKIPSFRRDLLREVDLIEEVVRRFGIERIPTRDRSRFTPVTAADRAYDYETKLRQRLVALGIFEVRTSALVPRSAAGAFRREALELRNPLSEDHVALRPSLLPGLLAVVARNVRLGAESIRVFELGRIFAAADGKETRSLAFAFCGKAEGATHWRSAGKRALDFFDLKGAIEAISPATLSLRRAKHEDLALAVEIHDGERAAGVIGRLTSERAADIGAGQPVYVAEIELDSSRAAQERSIRFRELEKFPSITRDIAMIAPEALTHEKILETILGEPLLEQVQLFDQLTGEEAVKRFGPGRKSLAYTLTYRDKNRTLTGEEVTSAHAKIRERLQRELEVELRE